MSKKTTSAKRRSTKTTTRSLVVVFVCIILAGAGVFIVLFLLGVNKSQSTDANPTAGKTHQITATIPENPVVPCSNNADADCKHAPSIDFYPSSGEGPQNAEFVMNGDIKEIMGKITSITGNTVTIQASSGKSYIVTFPIDAVSEFNTTRSSLYQGLTVGPGSTLLITYSESDSQHSLTINASQIQSSIIPY